MQVSVETTNTLERRITVAVPKEQVEQEFQNRLKSLARETKINGFRPGKVPVHVVEKRYGEQIRQETITKITQESFQEAIQQEKLHPVGHPTIDFQSDATNLTQGLSYTATFEIYPEVGPLKAEGLAVEKPLVTVTETDIDLMLQKLRKQRRTWQVVERPAAEGDKVTIDFVGTIDGQPFEANEAKNYHLIIDTSYDDPLIQEFSKTVIGTSQGTTCQAQVTFTTDHQKPEIAGKTVQFVITVGVVETSQLPELDVEFVKSLGVSDGNIETLRQDTRVNMQNTLEDVIKNKTKQQLFNALLEGNPLEVPKSLVEREVQRLVELREHQLQEMGVKKPEVNPAQFEEEALKRVKLSILIGELVEKQNIQVQADDLRQRVEKIAAAYEDPQSVANWFYSDKQRLNELHSMVLEELVIAWLLERAQVTEKVTDFYALIEQKPEKKSL